MSDQPPVRTALYEEHLALNGNMVDFHGFELPIWYTNIKDEHLATRSGAGLFDVSHMGSFRFTGEDVRAWLEESQPNASPPSNRHDALTPTFWTRMAFSLTT